MRAWTDPIPDGCWRRLRNSCVALDIPGTLGMGMGIPAAERDDGSLPLELGCGIPC